MKRKNLTGVSANVFLLGLVSLLNDFSSEMITPILPIFITALGGGGVVIGLIGGIRDSISSLLKLICGYWSDKTGKRKIFITSGYFVSAVFKLFLSWSVIWQHILVFAGFERIGKGLRTAARDAIIADSMPEQRGKGFGIHRAMDTLGAILGSVAVFILFWFFGFEFKTIILIAAVLALFSLIPLYFVREKKREPQKNTTLKMGLKSLPRSCKLFILIAGVFALANFSYMFFILRAGDFFSGRLSIGIPILLYILFNFFYALLAVPFGNLSDRIGRRKVLIFGYFIFSLTSFGFAFLPARFTSALISFIILFCLYGLVYAIVDGNQRAFISDLAKDGLKATALGAFHTTIGLSALPASLIAGILWQNIAPRAAFIYGGLVSSLSVALFLILRGYFRD